MKLVYENVKELYKILKQVEKVLPEVRMTIMPEGMEILEIDPARVAMIHVGLPAEVWETYEVEEPLVLGVELEPLLKILARAQKGDTVTFERPKADLVVKFQGKGRARRFTMALIEPEEDILQVPTLELPVYVKLQASVLDDMIKCADVVWERISLTTATDPPPFLGFNVESVMKTFSCELMEGAGLEELVAPEICESAYSLPYLKNVFSTTLAQDVELRFGDRLPLHLTYALSNGGTVEAWLAPIIEED